MLQEIKGFETLGEFFDDENFPKGFSKSGEFTLSEARLLEDYGLQLEMITLDPSKANTQEQKHLIKVLAGEKDAANALEKVWLKYRNKIEVGMVAISAFGSSMIDIDDADVGEDEPLDLDD